jgi:L-lactate dehydrogenase (cytochrome)
VTRRRPRWGDIAPLLGSPDRSRTSLQRRLDRCASIGDLRALARRRVPVPVFDYVDGAAGTESTLLRARAAFARVEFTPRVLRDVSEVDLSTTMLGATAAVPFAFAPTGFTRMMHHRGELAVAEAAGEAGIPYALSTLGTTSIEALAAAAPATRRWFQLYVWRDRAASEALVRRAADSGYNTLILTVDTAVGGIRRRDVRHGLTVPPQLTARTLARMAMRPRWWADVLTTEPLEFATLTSTGGTVGELLTRVFDGSMTMADIDWLRGIWPGRLMIKGVQSVGDARLLADAGVDAIVLSNHGGRQVDRGNVPLELLPQVTAELGGQVEVYLDGGITSGADIVAALAFGATGTLVGRAYLYGLMAGGADGVRRAVEILTAEIRTTMQLVGVRSVAELGPSYVRLRD